MFGPKTLRSISGTTKHRVVPHSLTFVADFLIVAGAGSAGVGVYNYGGGGGAGGLICSGQALQGGGGSAQSSITLGMGLYSIVVAGETVGVSNQYQGVVGSNSSAFGHTALGGGLAGGSQAYQPAGGGGSGGGGAGGDYGYQTGGGSGTANQGYGGGVSGNNSMPGKWGASGGGGGGGAGGTGGNALYDPVYPSNPQYYQHGGAGGEGLLWIDGNVYACGGPGGPGGVPGNTQGAFAANYPNGGAPNRGFGGDCSRIDAKSTVKGYGGGGVVIIRYSANQGFTTSGGTQTRVGGYIFETFTTSATLVVS